METPWLDKEKVLKMEEFEYSAYHRYQYVWMQFPEGDNCVACSYREGYSYFQEKYPGIFGYEIL